MTLIKKSIMTLLLAAGSTSSVFSAQCPLKLSEIDELFSQNPEVMEEAIKWGIEEIIKYHEDPIDDLQQTAYLKDIQAICQQAREFISPEEFSPNILAIVCDIDETCLSGYNFCKSCNFGSKKGNAFEYRKQKKCTAIVPVRELINDLKNRGYTIIYISSRRDALTQKTRENLEEQGFPVDKLVLMPHDLWQANAPVGAWKESIRKHYTDEWGYKIVANFGDSSTDFEGEYNGYIAKLPNALY